MHSVPFYWASLHAYQTYTCYIWTQARIYIHICLYMYTHMDTNVHTYVYMLYILDYVYVDICPHICPTSMCTYIVPVYILIICMYACSEIDRYIYI